MAKMKWLYKLIILCLLLCLTQVTMASHMIAVEIRARPINCVNRTYEITLIGYVNTASMVAFGGDRDFLSFGDGQSILVPEQVPVVIDPILNIGRVQYTIVHTYGSVGKYLLSYREHARNAGIMNMEQSEITTFYTESAFTIADGNCDASPFLTVPPIDRACSGIAYYHNAGAIDPNDDSVSFSLVKPRSDTNIDVIDYANPNDRKFYNALGMSFNQGNEIKNGPPNFAIDPVDGTLSWDAPGVTGEYALAIKVTGWRYNAADSAWVESGFCIRDMQVIVEDCNNKKPDIVIPDELCVLAGESLEFTIHGSDPDGDPVVIEAFSDIFTLTENPGMFSPSGAPLQSTAEPFDTAKLHFSWNTSCLHVKSQPYKVVIKITDSPPAGPKLVRFKTISIKVIAPPLEFETVSINPVAKTATLTWKANACENIENIQVWRRVSAYPYLQPICNMGMPYFLRYQLMATLSGDAESYLDSDLSIGAEYCYRIVALVGQNKIHSRISLDTCFIPRPAEAPVLTNVSVITTDDTEGSIQVRWTSPFDINQIQYPRPYQYKVYRSDPTTSFAEVTPTAQADTVYTDVGINTQRQPYTYRVELYVPGITTAPVDTSSIAGSVFLEVRSLPGKISLIWEANTPWYNYTHRYPNHLIYRSEVSQDGPFILIDSVDVNEHGFHYVDSGKFENRSLTDGKNYYYKVLTRGSYGNPAIGEPLENFSNVSGTTTLDIKPPCTPIVVIEVIDCSSLDCSTDTYYNRISWSFEDETCLEVGLTYRIFAADTEEGPFETLTTLQGDSFQDNNLSSLAKCYRVAAIDPVGNLSALSEIVCNDNCPYFELPNVFTPGTEDGMNDAFLAFGPATENIRCSRFVKQVDLTVYNRWGEKIYFISTAELDTNTMLWNGLSDSGKETEAGIYFYSAHVTFDVRDPSQQHKLFKGWVHLIRGR